MSMTRLMPLLLAAAMMHGCADTDGISVIGRSAYAPVEPSSVRFYIDSQAVKRDYSVLGYVSAELAATSPDKPVEDSELIRMLKAKAASLGADAIVLQSMFVGEDDSIVSGFRSDVEKKRARAAAIKFNR